MASGRRSLAGKAFLRLQRPLLKLAGFEWGLLPKAKRAFARPWPVLLRYLEMKAVRDPWDVALRGGSVLRIHTGDDLVCVWDCWVKEEYALAGDEKVIVDAGANLGSFAFYARHRAPAARIHALEPVGKTYGDLVHNIEANRMQGSIIALKLGVAGRSGEARISTGGSSPYSSLYGSPDGAGETIALRSLADLLVEIGNPECVDLIKLDCEGAEMDCLLHADKAVLGRFRKILFEYHTLSGFTYAALEAHLGAAGFRCEQVNHFPEFGTGVARFSRS